MLNPSDAVNCNVLLIGKKGAGKSSFANYLFGTDIFTAGSGEPVAGWENNFRQYRLPMSGIVVNVFDSVGLETDNFDKWTEQLDEFLSQLRPDSGGGATPASETMHTLFYVVNAAGAQFNEAELKTIELIQYEYQLIASIIITNCDIAKEDDIAAIENKVGRHNLCSFRVCSVSGEAQAGGKARQFGKEPAIEQLLSASFEKVGKELTIALVNETIDGSPSGKALRDITDLVSEKFVNYYKFLESFTTDYHGRDILNEIMDIMQTAAREAGANGGACAIAENAKSRLRSLLDKVQDDND